MNRPAPFSVQLLDRPVSQSMAAELLGVDAALFRDAPRLLLRDAFRIALRPALQARHISRGTRRAKMRTEIAALRRATATVPGELLALALRIAARQAAGELEAEADRLATIAPKAAARLRKAAQAALDAANADAASIHPVSERTEK